MSLESRLHRRLQHHPAPVADAIAASRLLMRTAHLLEARIDAALAPYDLAMREYLALVLIADDAVEPLRPSDLSVTLDATRTQITRLLDGLEHKGLVRRLPASGDRRSLQLAQTEAGAQRLAAATPVVHEAYQGAWQPLDEADVRQTRDWLQALHANLLPGDEAA